MKKEAASDNGGVYRDCLSEFWQSINEQYTIGSRTKLPYIRHDLTLDHWKAIAKIIVSGYNDQHYFPVTFVPIFMYECMLHHYDDAELLSNFLEFIPDFEKAILQKALLDYKSVENEELLEVLETHEVKKLVTDCNLYSVLLEVAHKELVQM